MSGKPRPTKTPAVAALLSVTPWREMHSGEENGDIVIALDINGVLTRVRLPDADAQHLADAIPPIREAIAIRRRASAARRRAFQSRFDAGESADASELPASPQTQEGERHTPLP